MKKVLIMVMALLTVFAIMGCKTDSDPGGSAPGIDPDNGNEGFVPPENWIGFTKDEMLAAKFFINVTGQGDNPDGTSISKNTDGSYSVTLKTVTSNESKASVVWVDFEDIDGKPREVFRNGWYASLALPATGVRPVNVDVIPVPVGVKGADGGIAWDCSQNAVNTGDLPATMDGLYVVGDLSMRWGTEEPKTTDFKGLAIWFIWAPVGTEEGENYTFTIKDLKVLPHDTSTADPELEAWTPDPVAEPAGWVDLPSPVISGSSPGAATMVSNGTGGYTVTAKTTTGDHTEITLKGADVLFKGGYYLSLTLPERTQSGTDKVKRIYSRADNYWNSAADIQEAFKWIQGRVDCMYAHEEFGVRGTIVLSIYWHPGVAENEDYVFTINSIKVAEVSTEVPLSEKPEIHESSKLEDATYSVGETAVPLKVVPVFTDNSKDYDYSWFKTITGSLSDSVWISDGIANDDGEGVSFTPPTDTAGEMYYFVKIEFGSEVTYSDFVKITVTE